MSEMQLAFELSKEALKLVKEGKAIISSGGVRLLDGTLFELAKPVFKPGNIFRSAYDALSGGVTGIINAASSVMGNVQNGFIQHGVNVANNRLVDIGKNVAGIGKQNANILNQVNKLSKQNYNISQQLSGITNSLGSLSSVPALSGLSVGLGAINVALSIKILKDMHKGFDEIRTQVDEFHKEYKSDQQREFIAKYDKLTKNIEGYAEQLKGARNNSSYQFVQFEHHVMENLNAIATYLEDSISRFFDGSIDRNITSKVIYTLAPLYAMLVNDYCCLYYYNHNHDTTHMIDKWCSPLIEISDGKFLQALLHEINYGISYIEVSPEIRSKARCILSEVIPQLTKTIELNLDAIQKIDKDTYFSSSESAAILICQSDFEQIEKSIRDTCDGDQEYSLADQIKAQIEHSHYVESEEDKDKVYIPIMQSIAITA